MAGGRRKKRGIGHTIGTVVSTMVLVIALAVFAFAAWKLWGFYREYKAGSDEYSNLNSQYVDTSGGSNGSGSGGSSGSGGQSGSGGAEEVLGEEGDPLPDYHELENPDTVKDKLKQALLKNTVENGEEKSLPVLRNPVDFANLQGINSDIIGWITINALNISYPVAQAADNDYYLHRTFERADNFAGCIFLNCDNSRYFTDQNTIIYGHNMKDGSMFGTLNRLQDQKVYDSSPYFWVFTPEFIYQYRIFSCSVVSKVGDPYRTRFTTEEFQHFIDASASGSYVDAHGVKPTTADRICTLSTCTGDDSTRFIVQGMLEQIYVSR